MDSEHLGDRLARLRRFRELTQEQLAERADVSIDVIRKLEQRRRSGAHSETLRRLARGLGMHPSVLLGGSHQEPPEQTARAGVDRRTVVVSAAAAAALPRRVDPELVSYFQQQLDGHYRADMLLGPRALIDTVTAQCDLIRQLVDRADPATRRRLATVGTSYALFAAWLNLDAGDTSRALVWHDVAQELAHRSHNRDAVACALVDRAMARTDQGMGAAVVDLCEAALSGDGLTPEVRVFAMQQQAHGAALIGDRHQVDALLDNAGRLVDRVSVEEWGTACLRTPHYVEVQRATCYGRLGLASEADSLWEQIIPTAPPMARRDVGVWTARQAAASAARGEPDRAVELARSAAGLAGETGSARAVRELAGVEAAMTPWRNEQVGQDLRQVLAGLTN